MIWIGVITAFLPLAWVGYGLGNAIDPIKSLYGVSGVSAVIFLLLSLLPSTCKRVCGYNLLRYRRTFGLIAFSYVLLHVLVFIVLDAAGDMAFVVSESLKKPFVFVGMSAFLILLGMTITSTKQLLKRFSKYHQAVYVAVILAVTHAFWAQKVAGIFEYMLVLLAIIFLGERLIFRMKNL